MRDGEKAVDAVARERGLSAKYLGSLLKLHGREEPSLLLDGLRARWRTAKPENVPAMVAEIGEWQKALWKFSSVGHIGKVDGPKAWMEPVTPLVSQQELRLKLAPPANANEVVIYLTAGDAGDGAAGDFVVWQQPRLSSPGRPPILLRDVRGLVAELTARRERVFSSTTRALAAAAEAGAGKGDVDTAALAQHHGVDPEALTAWFDYLGIGPGSEIKLDHFTKPLPKSGEYDFVQGWGSPDLPSLLANSSDTARADSGEHEAARRRGASVADARGGGRLAESGDGDDAHRGDCNACTSGVRQWRGVVAGTSPRQHAAAARVRRVARREAGRGRAGRKGGRAAWGPDFAPHRAARWQSFVRSHRPGVQAQRGGRCAAGLVADARRFRQRARGKSSRGQGRARRCVAFLHRSRCRVRQTAR